MYVGKSNSNVMQRINSHYNDKSKIFDEFSFEDKFDLSDKELELLEAQLIRMYIPKYNIVHNDLNKPHRLTMSKACKTHK